MRNLIVRGALIISLGLPLVMVVAALGTKFGIWHWSIGLAILPLAILIALALALVALVVTIFTQPKRDIILAIIALMIPLLAGGRIVGTAQLGGAIPIHDISTDWETPLLFSDKVMGIRGPDSNPVSAVPKAVNEEKTPVAEVQAQLYPDLERIFVGTSVQESMQITQTLIEGYGWTLHTNSVEAGVLEATAETFWYGFKDDIIVRFVTLDDGQTQIDARSISRVGLSDLGTNAKRLKKLLKDIKIHTDIKERNGA